MNRTKIIKMSSQVMKIVDILEDIKTQISDSQYKNILDNLGVINENLDKLHKIRQIFTAELFDPRFL